MGLTDPVVIVCEPAKELPYTLQRGRETFFDADNYQHRWRTIQEAIDWSETTLGVSPLDHLPDNAQERGRQLMKDWREQDRQEPLF